MCEYIEKNALLKWLYKRKILHERCVDRAAATNAQTLALHEEGLETIEDVINKVERFETMKIDGSTSDGYHTFDELYYHRAILFSVIVSLYPELSWKSKKHDNGSMYDGMFIIGINTPSGQATYHYNFKECWELFKCKELETAPKWDGHTPADTIRRIGTLRGLSALKNNQNGSRENEKVRSIDRDPSFRKEQGNQSGHRGSGNEETGSHTSA